jgi:transcription elongation factor/antiterminator RfaH
MENQATAARATQDICAYAMGDNDMENERWYVVHTQPHAEERAILNLKRQGFHIYCPRIRKTVRHARKKVSVLAPLFPNYLFVRLNVERDGWRCINGTRGVLRLVAQGDVPHPVPAGVVESLHARIGADSSIQCESRFRIGEKVRIDDGPFSDFVGTLEHHDAAGRVRVLLELLGRSIFVALHGDALSPAT